MLFRTFPPLLLLSCSVFFVVQPAHTTPLPELLASLLQNHDRVQVAASRTEAAGHEVGQSRSGFLPAVDLTTDTGMENIDREFGGSSDDWRYRATLRGTQLLSDFGRTATEVARARAVEERAQAQFNVVKQDMLLEGVTACMNLIRSRERLARAEGSVASIEKQVAIEERLRAQGAGLSSDVLQAQAQLAGARSIAASFEGELLTAANRFQNLFHLFPDKKEISGMALPDHIGEALPPSSENALATGLAHNTFFSFAAKEVALAEKELQVQQKTLWPRLEFFAEAERRQDDDGSPGQRTDLAAGIQLTANLFRGFGDQQKIAAAQSRLQAAKSNLAFVRRQVEEQVKNAWDSYMVAGKRAALLQEQAESLDAFLKLARKERTLGVRSLLDVLNAEVAVLSAQSSAVAARVDQVTMACRLLHAMGTLSVDLFRLQEAAMQMDPATPVSRVRISSLRLTDSTPDREAR